MGDPIIKTEVLLGKEMDVIRRETRRPAPPVVAGEPVPALATFGFCAEFNQRTFIAEDGILCEQDVPVKMRDGITIYCDIYRPVNETNIPAIVSWSFYGKRPGDGSPEWQVMGVPPGVISNMAKFESTDPAFWCRNGFAVVNVDPRGVGYSEGDVSFFGTQDGRDGHDLIEWLADQWWCSGKVGMGGNSAVAMTQWRIAAEQPPHLACIAPWEGTTDIFRESLYEGGIPAISFNEFIVGSITGLGSVDDVCAMARKSPLMNEYWEDKIPAFENIRIPVSTTVCWNHFHLRGSLEAFRRIKSQKKWLRAHREFEWPDAYSPAGLEDLKRFFDRYLKGVRNGWELTPRVRLEVMDAYEFDFQTNRPEDRFPLKRTVYKKLFIDAGSGAMSPEPLESMSKVSYDGATGVVNFDMTFDEDTEITGYMKLRLWVEADGHDDMDLFVNVQKLDENGEWLPVHVLGEPHPGAWGKMRVSHRALDEKLSSDFQPVQSHLKEEKLAAGEIVPVDIEIWPHSRIWHKGQQIRVQLAGRYIREGWFEPLAWETDNRGQHIVHSGGQYDSYLQVPVIPPRYVAGDYVYR